MVSRLRTLIRDTKKLKGRWSLTPGHEVSYEGEGPDEEFSFKGSLIAAEPGRLVISATEKQNDKTTVTRLVKIAGRWKTDPRNRIAFEVEKESGRSDVLTFRSGWELGDRYEIVYSYKTTALKTRRRLERELVFSGAWDFSEKNHLAFLVGGDAQSRLRFRGAFQTPSILAKKGEIRYQLGAETSGQRRLRALVFFGKWKLSNRFGLSFELETGRDRRPAAHFGVQWRFDGTRRVEAELRSPQGEPLGLEVVFLRDFWKDGEAFFAVQKSSDESRLEAGARWTS